VDDRWESDVLRPGERARTRSDEATQESIEFNRGLLVGGGVLIGIGALVGLAGSVLVGSALLSATRQWASQLEEPPSEMAKRRWQQARAAASAGADAWRNNRQSESAS
jgi:hypothetical protein